MKKWILLLAVQVFTFSTMAATFTTMRFVTNDDNEHLISLDGLEITINNGMLTATSGDNVLTLPAADIATMEFSTKQSSAIDLENANYAGTVNVYGVDGRACGTFESAAAASTSLPAGTYIIKAENGQTSKLTIRK